MGGRRWIDNNLLDACGPDSCFTERCYPNILIHTYFITLFINLIVRHSFNTNVYTFNCENFVVCMNLGIIRPHFMFFDADTET